MTSPTPQPSQQPQGQQQQPPQGQGSQSLQSVVGNPQFMALSNGAKRIVLSRLYPTFSTLDPGAQDAFIQRLPTQGAIKRPTIDPKEYHSWNPWDNPNLVRGVAKTLPEIGGTAGGLAGAAAAAPTAELAGPATMVGGTALGAAAGKSAQLMIEHILSPKEASPVSKEGLESTAISGAIGGVTAAPGAVVDLLGNMILKRIATTASEDEASSVMQEFAEQAKSSNKLQTLRGGMAKATKQVTSDLDATLEQAKPIDANRLVQPIRSNATKGLEQIAKSEGEDSVQYKEAKKTMTTMERVMARYNLTASNIGKFGKRVAAKQVYDALESLQSMGEQSNNPMTKAAAKGLASVLKDGLKSQIPEAADDLERAERMGAANRALKAWMSEGGMSHRLLGRIAATAALNPKTTLLSSPALWMAIFKGMPQEFGRVAMHHEMYRAAP